MGGEIIHFQAASSLANGADNVLGDLAFVECRFPTFGDLDQ